MINEWNLKYKVYYEIMGKYYNILLRSFEIESIFIRL